MKDARHKRTNTTCFHLYEVTTVDKLTETESRMEVAKLGEEERAMGSYCLMRTKFEFGKMKTFWRWEMMMVGQQLECT